MTRHACSCVFSNSLARGHQECNHAHQNRNAPHRFRGGARQAHDNPVRGCATCGGLAAGWKGTARGRSRRGEPVPAPFAGLQTTVCNMRRPAPLPGRGATGARQPRSGLRHLRRSSRRVERRGTRSLTARGTRACSLCRVADHSLQHETPRTASGAGRDRRTTTPFGVAPPAAAWPPGGKARHAVAHGAGNPRLLPLPGCRPQSAT
ncbi:hypothetical protein Dvul_1292 [Nitratidesulfovibrio vulgaris DP4]|uniref:Uncharacterized protein n=1 Tax=Nitratidesulfovibrio vulgaris (strain DP4) TaxID=391774 RepID=A0A0H3A773_NITV4|nr:hypothetical protein Dvul_1292 [Nitratidesulfovibrio vulgaris DP4]